eukprot:TRINITY_DN394_c0_g1_i2.p1 TRINITY_DN394_c0_g1~~TRINITY_DN394_c0_g1_i2.p1  ORF type:complete len:471 (-),score=113.28 TRINITY_DN394_c0_g1_i2:31-1443(-)
MQNNIKEPVVAFVNTKSGGQQGKLVLEKLLRILPRNQVYDLIPNGPSAGLNAFKGQRFKVLACGGDGTVGWVLSEIDKIFTDDSPRPPLAIMPLGTGNDMARTMYWGASHSAKKLSSFLESIDAGRIVHLDRWQLSFFVDPTPLPPSPPSSSSLSSSPPPFAALEAAPPVEMMEIETEMKQMNNYFSIGADAQVAMQFHEAREAHPHKFQSRVQNYAWYMRFGLQKAAPLHAAVQLQVDHRTIPISPAIEAIVFLNIPSYAGGSRPWGRPNAKSQYAPSSVNDGMIEVVGLTSNFHIATIHAKVKRGLRLAQGRHVTLVTRYPVAAQVDGEPWILPPARTVISHAGTGVMLTNDKPCPSSAASPAPSPVPSPLTSPVLCRPSFVRQASSHFPSSSSSQQPKSATTTTVENSLNNSAPLLRRKDFHCDGCGTMCMHHTVPENQNRCNFTFSVVEPIPPPSSFMYTPQPPSQ